MIKKLFLTLLLFIPALAQAQTPLFEPAKDLRYTGGWNAPQFSGIDLNGDGFTDLFVFDRTSNRVFTFLNVRNEEWVYAPDFESRFPEMQAWVLLRDYDGDGDADIFTPAGIGIRVMKNMMNETASLSFETVADPLRILGRSGDLINLQIDLTDIPAIYDLDRDGDLDILTFTPLTGETIEFLKNTSVENTGTTENLDFEKADIRWGNITECNCTNYTFNGSGCRTGRLEHAGSSTLVLDMDADNDPDLLIGDVDCPNIVFLENKGGSDADFESVTNANFPRSRPVSISPFPATYYFDADFDGIPDLIAAPNIFFNEGNQTDFRKSAWLYKNNGEVNLPDFQFLKEDFLQSEMFDFGEESRPAAADLDNDGDLDLLVGNKGAFQSGVFSSSLFLLENTGNNENPVFEIRNEDFLSLFSENLQQIKPSFFDWNNDGKDDLCLTAYNPETREQISRVYLHTNESTELGGAFETASSESFGLALRFFDEVLFYRKEEKVRALIGRFQGTLELWERDNSGVWASLNTEIGGFSNQFSNRQQSLAISDWNRDSKPDLCIGNLGGRLFFVESFEEHLEETWSSESPYFFNSSFRDRENRFFGQGVTPLFFGKDLILGSRGGGLFYLKDRSEILSSDAAEIYDFSCRIYPNPARGFLYIQAETAVSYRLTDISGRLIRSSLPYYPTHKISLNNLPPGLYTVHLFSKNGKQTFRKVLIY